MKLPALENLLQEAMGLNAASIGSAAIARAVQERLSACNLADPAVYLEQVRGSSAELQALIEAVVVPETWFFRDSAAFTALASMTRDEWLPAHPGRALSLLSLPCSTGEEPYSMTMALVDAGVPLNRFRVDAVDISTRNLTLAARAIYGRNSFRGQDLGFRDRHFDATPVGFRLRDNIRQPVRFQQGNLLAADLLSGAAPYDVIFCRNVLIYFDRPTQDRALVALNRLLHDEGMLFVAPAETGLPTSHGLTSTRTPLAFAFRKGGAAPPAPKRKAAPPSAPLVLPRRVAAAGPVAQNARVPSAVLAARPASVPSRQPAGVGVDLAEAGRLADQGRFVEAAKCCEEHLRKCGPSATAFYLLGLVRDATGGHADAAAFYRKALYLDAKHYDALIHLALLMAEQGDVAGAQVLRNRARRLEKKSETSHG